MPNPAISVVIPIFNAEKFLRETINSVLNQTFHDLEVILVNDGSKDESLKICMEFKKKDNRVVVITKDNGGVCSSRNVGIKAANGEYISIIDHDDFCKPGMYENLWHAVEAFHPDIVKCGFENVSKSKTRTVSFNFPCNTLLDRNYILNFIIPPMVGLSNGANKAIVGHWVNLYRTKMLRDYDLLFDETRTKEEDHLFMVEVLNQTQSLMIIEGSFYQHIYRVGSLTKKYSDRFENIKCNFKRYEELFGDRYNFHTSAKYRYNYHFAEESIQYLLCLDIAQKEKRNKIIDILKEPLILSWLKGMDNLKEHEKVITRLLTNGNFRAAYYLYVFLNVPKYLRGITKHVSNK